MITAAEAKIMSLKKTQQFIKDDGPEYLKQLISVKIKVEAEKGYEIAMMKVKQMGNRHIDEVLKEFEKDGFTTLYISMEAGLYYGIIITW